MTATSATLVIHAVNGNTVTLEDLDAETEREILDAYRDEKVHVLEFSRGTHAAGIGQVTTTTMYLNKSNIARIDKHETTTQTLADEGRSLLAKVDREYAKMPATVRSSSNCAGHGYLA